MRNCPQSVISFSRYVTTIAIIIAIPTHAIGAIVATPFGPNGEGGSLNGQALYFGSGGEIFELDAFLNIAGQDLNGSSLGSSAQLSTNSVPVDLGFQFTASLSPDASDLILHYQFTNQGAMDIDGVWFGVFVDPEIDVPLNDYFNEAGFVIGFPGLGAEDAFPDTWEIDEPGYVFGDIFSNLLDASLDGSNAVTFAAPDDVSMALGFALGSLHPGDVATIRILLSDAGNSFDGLVLQHFDSAASSTDFLTLSGASEVTQIPEAGSLTMIAVSALIAGSVIGRNRIVR